MTIQKKTAIKTDPGNVAEPASSVQQASTHTLDFLRKTEARRKKRECVRVIDMRGKVPYECKSYVYKKQVFWMDDISYGIFLKGLKKNNRVFTNQMFEEIVNGAHTKHKHHQSVNHAGQNKVKQLHTTVYSDDDHRIEGKEAELFKLGYYQKRQETRLKHTTEILIQTATASVIAKTKDISATGFKCSFTQPVSINKGDAVYISYTGFNNNYKSELIKIRYEITYVEYSEPEFIVCARLTDEQSEIKEFILKFIGEQLQSVKGKRKLDLEDIKLTAESLLTELTYTNSTPSIPFYISASDHTLELQAIGVNDANRSSLQHFKNSNECYDFKNLSTLERIQSFTGRLVKNEKSNALLAVFTLANGTPGMMFDYEFETQDDWHLFITAKYRQNDLAVFKVISQYINTPDPRKYIEVIEKLKSKSLSSVEQIISFYKNMIATGSMVNISAVLAKQLRDNKSDIDIECFNDLIAQHNPSTGHDVEILPFGYTEQRHEDRYHVSVDVALHTTKQKIKGMTKDISLKGLCIELDEICDSFKKGDEVLIDFPVLHKRAQDRIKLINMPYTITCMHEEQGKQILHFRREKSNLWNQYTAFFKDMIDRNIKLIKLDTNDIDTAAKSSLISSITSVNTSTLPIFILKNEEGSKTADIAIPPQNCELIDFFEVEPGVFNFKPLTDPKRLSWLCNHIKDDQSNLIIYMYKKQLPGIAKFVIYSATESEFKDSQDRQHFMEQCLDHDYCIVKTSISQVTSASDTGNSEIIDHLQEVAPHNAHRLINKFKRIVAAGDIIDMTHELPINI